jgi:hypothetical protein
VISEICFAIHELAITVFKFIHIMVMACRSVIKYDCFAILFKGKSHPLV